MREKIIETDLPSRNFQPLVYGVGAWTSHLQFAYDLVALLRPRLLVELGVDRGESYFAFCQSAAENETGTRCVGIDLWQGDEHAGGYDETTFREVSEHNAAHYAAFSILRRANFETAHAEFSAESIDVLHIDGLHTEAAVRRDLAAWLPKLRAGGILLLHDVGVTSHGFGVWKVWQEMRGSSRSWTFEEGPGLGVWQKPPGDRLPGALEDLFSSPNERSAGMMEYYRVRATDMQERIAQHWRDGSIRQTPFAHQTAIQIFYSRDGVHRAEDSTSTRIGNDTWKDVTITLPAGAGAVPLRIDFDSALTKIDLEAMTVTAAGREVYAATSARDYDAVAVAGDAQRLPRESGLRIQVTGIDPQLILPRLTIGPEAEPLAVHLRLCVHSQAGAVD
jgi:hypothetical protein